MKYTVNDIIRFHRKTGFRVWQITGVLLGGLGQENHYQMRSLDLYGGNNVEGKHSESLIPIDLLDSHTGVDRVYSAELATPPTGMNHFCPGESGSGEWSCRSNIPSRCGYCGEPNEALRKQGEFKAN